ncbi:MAG: hypothetical protein AB1894_06540 [Chloroflexota bacterium]
MDERDRMERFNHELDTILCERSSAMVGLSEEEKRSLDVARRLAHVDLSSQSRVRQSLRRRLALQVRCHAPAKIVPTMGKATPVALLLVILIILFGWMSTGMTLPSSGNGDANITSYRISDNSIVPTASAQALAPTPVSVPLAPSISSASAPVRTQQQSTPSNLNTNYTPNSSAVVTP